VSGLRANLLDGVRFGFLYTAFCVLIELFCSANRLPLIVVLDGIRGVGNVSSVLRTLAAVGCGKVLTTAGAPTIRPSHHHQHWRFRNGRHEQCARATRIAERGIEALSAAPIILGCHSIAHSSRRKCIPSPSNSLHSIERRDERFLEDTF
jgi:hypothetical protein